MRVLPLNPRKHDTPNKKALCQKENDQHRHSGHKGGGHQQLHLGANPCAALKVGYAQRHGVHIFRIQIDQRVEEIIPRTNKAKNRHCHQRRRGQWQHDAGKDLPAAGAINAPRVFQVERNRHKELAQQEDVKRIAKERWHNQWVEGVKPIQTLKDDKGRHNRHGARQHQGREQNQEDQIAPW